MRIATYNIWNCEENNELRFAQITDELVKINADIIALQEVPNKNYFDIFLKNTNMNTVFFILIAVKMKVFPLFRSIL